MLWQNVLGLNVLVLNSSILQWFIRRKPLLERNKFSKLHGLKLTMSSPRPELGFAKRALPLMLPYPVLEKGIPHIRLFRCKRLTWGLGRQHCRLSICEYWLSWTNTVSEQKIPISILILKRRPCLHWRSSLSSFYLSLSVKGVKWMKTSRLTKMLSNCAKILFNSLVTSIT